MNQDSTNQGSTNQDSAGLIQQSQNKYRISGVVDFETTPGLMLSASGFIRGAGRNKMNSVDEIEVDLAQVTDCNSAGLTLMLEMAREAQRNNIEMHFTNIPETLSTMAKAYGIENEIRDICK